MSSPESKVHSDAEPMPVSEDIEKGFDVGSDGSKHSHADLNSDGGGAAAQRVGRSIGRVLFDS